MVARDIKRLQWSLNICGYECGKPDGIFGPKSRAAFNSYRYSIPDRDMTMYEALRSLTDDPRMPHHSDFERVAGAFGIPVTLAYAICDVESSGSGFIRHTPKWLYEGHKMFKYLSIHRGKAQALKIAARYPTLVYPKWTKRFYPKTVLQKKDRINRAMKIDRTGALWASSWGLFQIMGFHYAKLGYRSPQRMVDDMSTGVSVHFDMFIEYCNKVQPKAGDALRHGELKKFVRYYNGTGQVDDYYRHIILAKGKASFLLAQYPD